MKVILVAVALAKTLPRPRAASHQKRAPDMNDFVAAAAYGGYTFPLFATPFFCHLMPFTEAT